MHPTRSFVSFRFVSPSFLPSFVSFVCSFVSHCARRLVLIPVLYSFRTRPRSHSRPRSSRVVCLRRVVCPRRTSLAIVNSFATHSQPIRSCHIPFLSFFLLPISRHHADFPPQPLSRIAYHRAPCHVSFTNDDDDDDSCRYVRTWFHHHRRRRPSSFQSSSSSSFVSCSFVSCAFAFAYGVAFVRLRLHFPPCLRLPFVLVRLVCVCRLCLRCFRSSSSSLRSRVAFIVLVLVNPSSFHLRSHLRSMVSTLNIAQKSYPQHSLPSKTRSRQTTPRPPMRAEQSSSEDLCARVTFRTPTRIHTKGIEELENEA